MQDRTNHRFPISKPHKSIRERRDYRANHQRLQMWMDARPRQAPMMEECVIMPAPNCRPAGSQKPPYGEAVG